MSAFAVCGVLHRLMMAGAVEAAPTESTARRRPLDAPRRPAADAAHRQR